MYQSPLVFEVGLYRAVLWSGTASSILYGSVHGFDPHQAARGFNTDLACAERSGQQSLKPGMLRHPYGSGKANVQIQLPRRSVRCP